MAPQTGSETAAKPAAARRRCVLAGLVSLTSAAAAACAETKREATQATPSRPAPTPAAGAGQAVSGAPAPPAPPEQDAPPVTYSPLTGQAVHDPALVHRRIVAVKVDNAPLARPQLGLAAADLVYEQLAEGGTTRFLAMYLLQEPERIGPVRSARLTDIYLGQEWDFLLAYAGAGRTTSRLLEEALIPLFKAPELGENLRGTPYFREPRRPVPHNLFVRIAEIREAARQDPAITPEVEIRPLPFHDAPTEAGPLRVVTVPYIPPGPVTLRFTVTWRYDTEAGAWKRVMAGAPHVDALSGQQIQVENVLIEYAELFTARNVEPDAAGNPVLDAVLRGENRVRLFHSGHIFEGTWSKEHDRAKTQYRLVNGNPLPFRPGKVWIHIVPTDFQATWS